MKSFALFQFLVLFQGLQAQNEQFAVDSIVNHYYQKYQVPGMAVSIIKPEHVFYRIIGKTKIETEDEVTLQSKFHLGSNTKAITATIAAHLVEKGTLQWTDKLVKVVPELAGNIHPDYNRITLEQLLSHRTGVAAFEDDGSKEWRRIPADLKNSKNPKLCFAKYALNLKPAPLINESHHYSNGGFIIAGLMLEKASGQSWSSLVDDFFNKMNTTYFVGYPSEEYLLGTRGHIMGPGKKKKYKSVEPKDELQIGAFFSPAGHFSMSIEGFTKFIQMHLDGLMGVRNILKPETFQKIHYGFPDYSLGWYNGFIGDTKKRFSYHGGSLGTFSSAVIISADREVAIVILVNADNKQITQMKNELRESLWRIFGAED